MPLLGRLLHVLAPSTILLVLLYTLAAQSSPTAVKVQLSFTTPAFVGMPIWVTINTPSPHKIHYPASTAPSDFGCNSLEVKAGGHLLVPEQHPNPGGTSGPACGWVSAPDSPESRLPLHIQYSLERPGTYLVRYTQYEVVVENGQVNKRTSEQSDWTPLELRSAPPDGVHQWVSSLLTNLPPNAGILVGDALPSLLAQPSRSVFRAMLQATYNPNEVVSRYASNTIPMFEPSIVRNEMLDVVRRLGPDDALAYAFSSYGKILSPIAPEVAITTAAYLRSLKPSQVIAATHMLSVLTQPYYALKADTIHEIDVSVEKAVDTIIAGRNENAASWVAQYLVNSKLATAHEQLWKLADANLAVEQTLICISWLHDPADLPKIVKVVEAFDPADPYGENNSGIVGNLRYGYGDAIRPYMRHILKTSRQVWVRVAAAKELILMGDSTGYQFFLETLHAHPFYHDELVRWLQDAFPTMRKADEATMTKFLRSQMQTE
jgi:hypothetical protein